MLHVLSTGANRLPDILSDRFTGIALGPDAVISQAHIPYMTFLADPQNAV
jgi:hypothetical protein